MKPVKMCYLTRLRASLDKSWYYNYNLCTIDFGNDFGNDFRIESTELHVFGGDTFTGKKTKDNLLDLTFVLQRYINIQPARQAHGQVLLGKKYTRADLEVVGVSHGAYSCARTWFLAMKCWLGGTRFKVVTCVSREVLFVVSARSPSCRAVGFYVTCGRRPRRRCDGIPRKRAPSQTCPVPAAFVGLTPNA